MKIQPRLIPRNDPEANVVAYMEREKPLKKVLHGYAKRNTKGMMDRITSILSMAGYDGTNKTSVMLKQADPSTIRSLEELAQRLPEGRRQAFQSKLYGQVGAGSLTVRKAVDNVMKYGATAYVKEMYEEGKNVLRDTAKEGMYRGEFMVQKSVGVGWTMETPGIREVDAFLKDKWSMKDATEYLQPMTQIVKDQVEEALFMGESPQKMAKRLERVDEINDIRAKRNARTITTAVANEAQMGQYKKEGIAEYRWVATFDERTCPVCGELDGKRFKVGKGEYPPKHPNCRCTTEAVLSTEDEDDIESILEAHKNDPRAKKIPKGMTVQQWKQQNVAPPAPKDAKPKQPTNKQKTKKKITSREERFKSEAEAKRVESLGKGYEYTKQEHLNKFIKKKLSKAVKKETITKEQYDSIIKTYDSFGDDIWMSPLRRLSQATKGMSNSFFSELSLEVYDEEKQYEKAHVSDVLRERMHERQVEYKPVQILDKPKTETEIITSIADWDGTDGSCASQVMAYIGQKTGLDIQDFRDGESRQVFAEGGVRLISQSTGGERVRDSGIRECKKILNNLEPGEEYAFCAGHHASIVRMGQNGPEYLELQAAGKRAGWTPFEGNPYYENYTETLRKRFDVQDKSIGCDYVNIKNIMEREDILEVLGYINTPKSLGHRGAGGGVR